MGEDKPPSKLPRTSLVDSGWGDETDIEPVLVPAVGYGVDAEADASDTSEDGPAGPPPPPRPALPHLKAPPRPPRARPAPPRAAVDSVTEVANLLDEIEDQIDPAGSLQESDEDTMFTPAIVEAGELPEPEPGASGILPRFAMPSESDSSSPRIIDPADPASDSQVPVVASPAAPLPPPSVPPLAPAAESDDILEVISPEPPPPPRGEGSVAAAPAPEPPPAFVAGAPAAPATEPLAAMPELDPLPQGNMFGAPGPHPSEVPSLPPIGAGAPALSLAEALSEPVRVGSGKPALWLVLLAPAALLLLVGLGLGAALGSSGSSATTPVAASGVQVAAPAPSAPELASAAPSVAPEPPAPAASEAEPPEAPAPTGELAAVIRGDAEAMKALEAKAPDERSAAEALALARGRSAALRASWREFMDGLKQNPSELSDKAKKKQLEDYARNRELSTETLEAVAALGTEDALDFLYEIWVGTPKRTDTTQLAEELVMSNDLRKKASPALGVALELRTVDKDDPCASTKKLVQRAEKDGDVRSLHLLGRLGNKRGCGSSGRDDCYACLRKPDVLKDAIQSVRKRLTQKK
ncbi:MAG: hypothetical protein H6716_16525 [Polyangiaceae bacterium]|nr:hypothetical protein [Polyangiaceae bacterium]